MNALKTIISFLLLALLFAALGFMLWVGNLFFQIEMTLTSWLIATGITVILYIFMLYVTNYKYLKGIVIQNEEAPAEQEESTKTEDNNESHKVSTDNKKINGEETVTTTVTTVKGTEVKK